MVLVVHAADAAGDSPVVAESVSENKAGHGDLLNARFSLMISDQPVMKTDKRFLSVIIIGIDDGKGLMDHIFGGDNRLTGAPGFYAVRRSGEILRKIIQLLERVGHLNLLFHAISDDVSEILLQILPDNEHDAVKARLDGIVNRVIHDDLPAGSHRLQLFDSLAESASDSCCHNGQCCFFHTSLLHNMAGRLSTLCHPV